MLLIMSITGGALILLAALIRRLALGKMPKSLFLLLWGVALARLLIPFPALYPVSVPLPRALTAQAQTGRSTPDPSLTPTPEPGDAAGVRSELPHFPGDGGPAEAPAKAIPSSLTLVWAGGAILAALVFLGLYLFGLRRFHAARPLDGPGAAAWLRLHPLRRRLRLGVLPGLSSPMTHGLLLPVILLPEDLDPACPEAVFALEHEYVHVRRWDSLWKLLLTLALAVHWFNPAVWLMWFLASQDLELSCDEAVLRRLGSHRRREYADALVALEGRRSRLAGLGFGYGRAAERVRAIMRFRQPGRMRRVLSGLLVLGFTLCALGSLKAGAVLGMKKVYRSGGITLTVPADLADLVLVQAPELPEEQQDPQGDVVFRVFEKESWETGQLRHPGKEGREGFLFAILRIPEENAWGNAVLPASSRSFLARRGRETYYSLFISTDMTLAFGLGGVNTRSERWQRWLRVNRWAWSIREALCRDNPQLTICGDGDGFLSYRLFGALYGDGAEHYIRLGEDGERYPMPSGERAKNLLWDLIWETGGEGTVYRGIPGGEPLIISDSRSASELCFWQQDDLFIYRRSGSAQAWDAYHTASFLDGRSAGIFDLVRSLYAEARRSG